MKIDPKTVDEYIALQPEAVRGTLELVRSAICKALPKAEEVFSYEMPTYKLHGARVLQFAAWKQHYSLYLATERVVATFEAELVPYGLDKGTIRFPLGEPVPVTLIERIAKFRAKEIADRDPLR